MISFNQAFNLIQKQPISIQQEQIPLNELNHHVLMETISIKRNDPPFDRSLMDGFACKKNDLFKPLNIINMLHAGESFSGTIQSGEAIQIMTGAPVPLGGEIVFKIEDAEIIGDQVYYRGETVPYNIAPEGSYIKAGTKLLHPGTLLKPQQIGICAFCGYSKVMVSRKPIIAIIATGNELVSPESKQPDAASIYNSSSYQVYHQILAAGGIPLDLGIAPDQPEVIEALLQIGLKKADIILFTGGVSMGEKDYVRDLFEAQASDIFFKHIALKPGKRTFFGTINDHYCFGLPGNPVSTLIVFELLVKPFINRFLGYQIDQNYPECQLLEDAIDQDIGRTSFIPVYYTHEKVTPLRYHGSGNLTAYKNANGFIEIPAGETTLKKGTSIAVRPI